MQSKCFFLFVSLFATYTTFGQTAEYKRISLSVHAGMDFPIGTSNTAGCDPDFTIPFTKGFGGTFDGAYFFTKNYGVGLKYHFYTANGDGRFYNGDKYIICKFDETTHFIGASLHGRWFLGTRWKIPVNISVGNIHNNLSDYMEGVMYKNLNPPDAFFPVDRDRENRVYSWDDMACNTIGVMYAVGICYRIIPAIGISVYANGMFAGAKKQKMMYQPGSSIDIDVSRKMNRIGFSAGVDFSF